MEYPVILEADNGTIMASFPDVPEALTCGKDRADALAMAEDALLTAFKFYLEEGKPIPRPSRLKPGQEKITLSPLVVAKLAIYEVMRQEKITQTGLAERLQCDPRQVRRLLNLGHNSRLDQLDKALKVLGRRLVVEVEKAA